MVSKQSVPHLRIFVGTSAGGEDEEACVALEGSLRRRASIPVEVERLQLSRDPDSPCGGWNAERWATPWTALRWAVPEICGWHGRAAYFDCPGLVLGDVAELAAAELPRGAFLLARREGRELLTSCLVLDCAEAKKYLQLPNMKSDVGAHQEVAALIERRQSLVGPLPAGWGWSDQAYAQARQDEAPARSVHFLRPHTQPHGPLADARLRRAGREHWFKGMRLPHYCSRLVELWKAEYVFEEPMEKIRP